MLQTLADYFVTSEFMPHGHCFLWTPYLLWLYVAADSVIGLAYYSIPIALWYFVRKRRDLPFRWVFVLFGLFVFACGTTHFIAVWGIWQPVYWLDAGVKTVTAAASIATAALLWPLIPRALLIPDRQQLLAVNHRLQHEISERMQAEDEVRRLNSVLEGRIAERTAELEQSNRELQLQMEERKLMEERFAVIFRQAGIGLIHCDLGGRFLQVNDKFCEITGYSRDELSAMRFGQLSLPGETDMFLSERKDLLAGKSDSYASEKHYVRKDGSLFWGRFTTSLARKSNGEPEYLIRSFEDITERKQVEQALRDSEKALRNSEQRLRTITDNVPALIGYIDSELRYRFANRTYKDWHGESPEQLYGRKLREVVGENYYAQIRPYIEAVFAGRATTFEGLTRSRIRELYARITYLPDTSEKGEVEGFYILGYDITQHRKTEEALARERTLLRQVIDNLPDHVYVKDRERRYLLINAPSLEARGIADHDKVVGKTAFDFYPPEVAAQYDDEDRSVMETCSTLVNREQFSTRADGQRKWHLTTKVPMRDIHGEIIGIVGINRDVTEIKQGQEAIRELNTLLEQRVVERTAQLEMSNKELESFAYSVSHDLRAPLRSIDGFSQALIEDYRDTLDQTAVGYLQRVRNASQRMAVLIDDLLELSRIARREMRREATDISLLAQEIVADLQKEQPERTVDIRITPGIRLQADANLLRVALDNLMRNAWKFTSKQAHAKIEVGMERRDDGPVYFVRDNGVGFDMNYAGKLFGAFQRLHSDAEFPGTGIGLATVQRIVRRHGGNIWAEAAPGRGAAFFFTMGASADC